MSLEEGLELARFCRARLLVPHHYELFAFNSRPLTDIQAVLADSGLAHLTPAVGETVDLEAMLTGLREPA
jgi:L-ascorbate metabolism protein UlaG (beta-lactamase superfamily)